MHSTVESGGQRGRGQDCPNAETGWQQLRAASLTGPGGDRAPCPDMAAGQLSGQMPGRRPGREAAPGAGPSPLQRQRRCDRVNNGSAAPHWREG